MRVFKGEVGRVLHEEIESSAALIGRLGCEHAVDVASLMPSRERRASLKSRDGTFPRRKHVPSTLGTSLARSRDVT
jgi:hypothetical protein